MNQMNARKIVVLETVYGSVDEEMDEERYQFDHVFADHFKTMAEAEEYARDANRTRSMGGRYSYRAATR